MRDRGLGWRSVPAGEAVQLPAGDRRVLVCTAHFHPHVGGVERYTRELFRRLVRRGWSIVNLTGDTDRAGRYDVVDGICVLRVPVANAMHGRLPIVIPGPVLVNILRRVAAWAPAVVVTNTRFFTMSLIGVAFARRHGIPSLHIDHGAQHVTVGSRIGDAISKAIDHTIGAWTVRHATRCVGCSQPVAAFMAHLGAPGAGVLHNGVDAAAFAGVPTTWRERLGIEPDARVIVYIGRLIEHKGVLDLFEAFARLNAGPAVHLVLAGGGELLGTLRDRAAQRPAIHVLGEIPAAEVGTLLNACDIFAHPSNCGWEGMPGAVLEAGAAGLPVVATPVGGTVEIIPSDDCGMMVTPGDVDALQQALARLLSDPPLRARLGRNLQQHIRAVFDWERIADRAEMELTQLIRTPGCESERRPDGGRNEMVVGH
jgi:glycosyltransferase involved in cell wall biosynthesis